MSTALVFDLETTADGGPDNDSPEAHWPINEVLMAGWALIDTDKSTYTIQTGTLEDFCNVYVSCRCDYLVAQNLKFDLKYVMRHFQEVLPTDWNPWCTMTWNYLSSGHEHKFRSLEQLASDYGVEIAKTMDLGEYIDAGGRMQDIPKDELEEYLRTDVHMLAKIWEEQLDYGEVYDMHYLYPLAEMELNGLPVDDDILHERANEASIICDEFTTMMKKKIKTNCEWKDGSPIEDADFEKKIKPTANRTLSYMLTGEPSAGVKCTSDKWTFQFKKCPAIGKLSPKMIAKIWSDPPTNLGYSMDEKHVSKLCSMLKPEHWVHKIQEWRKHDKLLNTYYLPFIVKSKYTGCVHPKLNTTATATGRLSSSDPNGQNMPKEARQLIKAPDGYTLCELDFSQLEVVALAMLSDDKRLIRDIKNGEDIHFNSGCTVMGWTTPSDMDKDSRRLVKNVNFGAIYGGKAPGLAYQTGIDKATVQKLIDSLYLRYPGIAKWQRRFYEDVVEEMRPNGHDSNGEQLYKSTVKEGGRKYTFKETPSPKWLRAKMGRSYSFNPNQVYNYPIQGYAGWGIVLQYLSYLWFKCPCEIKFLMTVHDSVLVMVPDDETSEEFKYLVDSTLNDFCMDNNIDVPLSLELEWGTNWS